MITPLLLILLAAPSRAAAPSVDSRVEALLQKMTFEEKVGQLQQLGGPVEGSPELIAAAAKGALGSTLNVRGPKAVNAIQRASLEKSRIKIPLLFGFDVIHGYRTVFPIPLALASSWDPALVERASRLAAREAAADGLRWTFSPMVDIARDPRWGRVAEGAGEDPYLGAALAAAYVRGYQGDPSSPDSLAACAKHWVGYGAAEAGRDYSTTEISDRTLREIYFPPFRAAVDAGALTFMSAFNDLDGVPSSANPFTLSEILRGEFGFRGFVVSDWDSVGQLIPHGIAADAADAARQALNAGVDMEMDDRLYAENLPALVKSGVVKPAVVDEAVRRILRVKFQLGLFEHPYADEKAASGAPTTASRAAAREAAVRTAVLLKNEGGVLPFKKTLKTLAVLGPMADDRAAVIGSWSGDGRPEEAVTVLAGLRAALPGVRVSFTTGCAINDASDAGFAAALDAARAADAVVLVLGEAGSMTGEASSRSSIDLPGRQLDLAKAVLALGKPSAVVLLNGRPLTIPWLAENAPAILEAWQPGTEGGSAVADLLFGDANPGGKLPMTFPRVLGQVPLYYNHKNTGRPPVEGDHKPTGNPWEDMNHYTSKYLDVDVTPQFPFGHGLSYTTFALSDLTLSSAQIAAGGELIARAVVTNTGSRAGDEVVQLYIHRPSASVTRPVRELKGFIRLALKPGEKRAVSFTLGPKELSVWGAAKHWSVEPGPVEVYVGDSSAGGLKTSFEISK